MARMLYAVAIMMSNTINDTVDFQKHHVLTWYCPPRYNHVLFTPIDIVSTSPPHFTYTTIFEEEEEEVATSNHQLATQTEPRPSTQKTHAYPTHDPRNLAYLAGFEINR